MYLEIGSEAGYMPIRVIRGATMMQNPANTPVIGGTKDKPNLVSGATNFFFFVITSDKPFPRTNLTAKVNFNRVVLEGGKLANPMTDVQIQAGH